MHKEKINLTEIIEKDIDPSDFTNALSYASTRIKNIELLNDQSCISIDFMGEKKELLELIEKLKNKIGKLGLKKMNEVTFQHSTKATPINGRSSVWEDMVNNKLIHLYHDGHIAYSGIFFELIKKIDQIFVEFSKSWDANEISLPHFIHWDNIKKLGLVDEYPQVLFFVSNLLNDIDKIEHFQHHGLKNIEFINNYTSTPICCLKTSGCSLLYPTLENNNLKENTFFTTLGHCSRHETFGVKTFERMIEFQMREIVYIGDEQGLEDFFKTFMEMLQIIAETFDLTSMICTANDSFFVSNYSKFKLMQMLGHSKYELRALVPDSDTYISVASLNNHQDFFSKRFGFTINGKKAVSACIGFGLERLVYSILSHHGLDAEKIRPKVNEFYEKCKELEQKRS